MPLRLTQFHIKSSSSISQYSYKEETNQPYRSDMEDNYVAEDEIVGKGTGLFGIFDGHGGRDVVQFCAKNVVEIFRDVYCGFKDQEPNLKLVFEDACKQLDKQMASLPFNSSDMGTTCSFAFIRQSNGKRMCYVANLGDSRGIICDQKGNPKRITVDHKAINPSEIDRIKRQGGAVFKGRVGGQLAITRALGDLYLKQYGVSNIPDYEQFQIGGNQYMILASDGLWDVCEDQQALEVCGDSTNTKEMVSKLMKCAMEGGSRDNISLMVLRF